MSRPNLNDLSREVARIEGGKRQQSIAEVKEVVRCTFLVMARDYTDEEILSSVKHYRNQVEKGLVPRAEFKR